MLCVLRAASIHAIAKTTPTTTPITIAVVWELLPLVLTGAADGAAAAAGATGLRAAAAAVMFVNRSKFGDSSPMSVRWSLVAIACRAACRKTEYR